MNCTNHRTLNKAGIFTLLFAASFTIMVGSIITPALPLIAGHLGLPHASSWLVTFPSLGVVLFGAFAGRFIERQGARLAMIVGLVLYGAIGVAAIFLSFSPRAVLADRLLLGGATAIVMSAGTALIAEFFEGVDRLRMIAVQGMAIEIGGVIFLSLGGYLGEKNWKLPFLLYLLSWLCLILFLCFVPSVSKTYHIDRKTDAPSGKIRSVLTAATVSMTLFFIAFITLPSSLGMRFHLNEAQTGYFLAFISLMAVTFAGCLPSATRLLKADTLLTVAFVLFGSAHLLLALSHRFGGMILGAVLMGCAFGFSIPLVNHRMVEVSAPETRGRNLGYLSICIFLGQFLSSFVNLASTDGVKVMGFTGIAALAIASAWYFAHRHLE